MSCVTLRAAALCLAALAPRAHADELALPRDGWASWQVAAVDDAPAWCCWSDWDANDAAPTTCRLDQDRANFGTHDRATTDAVRVYARITGGNVDRLRVLSSACPVEAATPILDLGTIHADASARWLAASLGRDANAASRELCDRMLAALALHRGDVAFDALSAIARGDARTENRKHAVFWLAHLRGPAGADIATSIMFDDANAELRKHAAFAITQSKSPRIASDLTRLGNTDRDAEVRAQAWFWLAHTGAASAEDAIIAALAKDQDARVREQAIFALSRLPDPRATRALIAAAENRSLAREQRKRAVFWLAQSASPAAQSYLEAVLAGKRAE